MPKSKKAMAKSGTRGHKLVFDNDGQAHEIYKFKEWQEGSDDEDGRQVIAKEVVRMQQADGRDKEEAKEKRRKGKDREREEGFPLFSINFFCISSYLLTPRQQGISNHNTVVRR